MTKTVFFAVTISVGVIVDAATPGSWATIIAAAMLGFAAITYVLSQDGDPPGPHQLVTAVFALVRRGRSGQPTQQPLPGPAEPGVGEGAGHAPGWAPLASDRPSPDDIPRL